MAILSLGLSSVSVAETPSPPCIADPAEMPASWRPPAELHKSLDRAPWSEAEAQDAESAKRKAVEELITYFDRNPEAVQNLWDDSVEALIQVTYASMNDPALDAEVRDAARDNLTALIAPYSQRSPESARCGDFPDLLPLALFAHRLYPDDEPLTEIITTWTNAAYRACGSFEAATNHVMQRALDNEPANSRDRETPERAESFDDLETLFDLSLWSIWLTEAQQFPAIELPAEARSFASTAWQYFQTYPLAGASEFPAGSRSDLFITIADLATHIAHVPTGVHRFPLYVDDSPALYRFHRENFYPVMQSDDLDLLASFMDTLRQYGCDAENDIQVRDGTRRLLEVFHDNGDRWMTVHGRGNAPSDMSDYSRVHRPWTAILGIRDRAPQHPEAGSYGDIIRSWLPSPHE